MKRFYSFIILLVACLVTVNLQADELTVNDGTTTISQVPLYGLYADYGTRSQYVVPATELGSMAGKSIMAIKYYSSSASQNLTGTWDVYLKEVTETSASATYISREGATKVWTGSPSVANNELNIEFTADFSYNGGNLMIEFVETSVGNCPNFTWYGTSGSSVYNYGGSSDHTTFQTAPTGSFVQYVPKTTFVYGVPSSCKKPSGLTISDITTSSAQISWTVNGQATAWQICLNGDEDNLIDVTANPYALEDLTPLTAYSVKVRANCGSEQSEWSSPVSFSTTAKATEVGESWSDNFEGDACGWELINGTNTNAWAWGEAVNNGGTHALYVSNDGGTTNEYSDGAVMVYASKLLQFADGKFQFSYDWKANGESSWDYLRVALVPASVTLTAGTSVPSGFSTTGLPTNWVALDGGSKLNLVTAWQNMSQAVNVTAGNYYLVVAWRNDGSGGSQAPAAVDNFSIVKLACPYDVAGLTVASNPAVTTSTATITWTAGGAEQWQVAYSLDNTFPEKGTETTYTKAASVDLTNLSSSSVYYVKVRAYCGGEDFGAWSAPISFVTACEAITSYPWSENFDSYELSSASTPSARILPTCWNVINTCTGSDYKWYPTIYYYSYTDHSHSSPNMLRLYSYYSYYGSSAQPQYAILPEMKNLDDKRIVFWAKGYNANSTIKVGRMTDPADASTFTQIGDELALTTDYQKFTINLSGTGNYIVIMIDAATSSRSYNGAYIDDIVVEDVPSCMEPSGLAFVSATTTSATFNWTAGGSETAWDIYYSTKNVAPTAETTPSIAAATAKAIPSGLSASTIYYVWVRAHCSDSDQSPWMGGISFQTECEPIVITKETPWTEGFENSEGTAYDVNGVIPVCWDNYSTGSVKPHVIGSGSSYYYVHEGTKSLSFKGNGYCYAILPEFANALNTLQLSFWMQTESSTYGTLKLGYITAADDNMSTFTEIKTFDNSYNVMSDREVELTSVPSEATRLVFQWYYSSGWSCCIDDIEMRLLPTCKKPVAPACNAKTAHTATLSWTAGDEGQNAWQIAVDSIANFNPDTLNAARLIDVTSNPAVISGLDANKTFYAYVRANCGTEDGVSAWSKAKATFRTQAGNLPVQNVAVHEPSLASDAATITWVGAATNDLHASYDLYYSKLNQLPEELVADSLFANIADTFKTLSGLTAETTYYVWVRDNCGTDGNSAWTSSLSFTTLANCPVPGGLSVSDIEAKSAKIAWSVGQNDSYNVRYRIAAGFDASLNEEFGESIPTDWTMYTGKLNESDGTATLASSTYCWSFGAGNGVFDNHARVNIYGDNQRWLVTPKIALNANELNFDLALTAYNGTLAAPATSGTDDKFIVLISEDKEAWSVLRKWDNAGSTYVYNDIAHSAEGEHVSLDVSAYNGKNVYIAFYGESTATNADNNLHIDNVKIGNVIAAGAWQIGNATTKELSLTGLVPETKYEAQVRGICGESETEWSESAFFTTIASCTAPVLTNPVILPDGATFSWTAGNGETQFEYACVEKDAQVEKWISLPANTLTVTINGKASGSNYDFYVRASCGDEDWSEAVKKTFTPLCKAPTAPQVAAITATTATISWTAADDEAIETYQYVVLPAASQLDWTSAEIVKATSAQLKGLTANTAYKVYIRSYYSETSQSTTISRTFTTECETFNMPFEQNFNELTSGIPSCWDNSEGTTTGADYKWCYYSTGVDGACVRFNSYYNSEDNTNVLATPTIHLAENAELTFMCKNPAGGDYSVKISVNGAARVDLLTDLTGISEWTEKTVDLSAHAGKDVIIYFCGTSNYGNGDAYLYLDEVSIKEKPSCIKPTNLAASDETTNSVVLSWTENGEATAWEIMLNDDAENLIAANTNPFTLEELDSSSKYSVKVRANCGDDKSEWSAAIAFNTLCEAVRVSATHAFEEGFEDTDFVPTCWESIASGSYKWTRATSSTYVHTGSASAYSGYYGDVYLVMPELAIADDDNAVKLTFWSSNSYSTSYDKNSVVLLGESETELWSPESVTSSWTETTIDLSAYKGQTIKLAFKYEGNNAHGWYVDDVKVEFEKGQATAIDAIESKEQAVKFIRENNLYIMLNGVIYDATGRKVETK